MVGAEKAGREWRLQLRAKCMRVGRSGVQTSDTRASSTTALVMPSPAPRRPVTPRPSAAIERQIGEVDHEIHDDHQGREEQHHVLDDDEVALG